MPRSTRSFGRAGTVVLPDAWDSDHARIVDATHKATVAIGSRSTVAAWDPYSGRMESHPVPPTYTGPASITLLDSSADAEVEAQDVSLRRYAVTVDRDVVVDPDHVVRVLTCPDAQLMGAVLDIDGVERGSSRFARHLTCTLG